MTVSTPPEPPSVSTGTRPIVRRRRGRSGLYAVIGIVVVVVALVGAGLTTNWYGLASPSKSSAGCPTGITLQGAGANFVLALVSQWQASYKVATSNLVNYNPDGAGAGITSLSEATVDFAATDEPLNASEVASMPGTTLTLPVTGGAVSIIYNIPGFTRPLNLTGALIADIYLGTVSNWNDPLLLANNPGLPNQPILTVHRFDPAGTTYVLTNVLSDDSSAWASGPGTSIAPNWPSTPNPQNAEKGNSALAKYVSSTPYTIGYVDLADAVSRSLPSAGIQNPAGHYVIPTISNTQGAINNLSGQPIPPATGDWSGVSWVNSPGSYDYPLAALTYFMVFQNPGIGFAPSLAKTQVLIQWLDWTMTSGQSYSGNLYYVNPPAKLLTQDKSALAGMNFNGATVPGCG
jgi:phosphate transport system substrate-binding protein